jgi:MinD superfamily P-loop ATPase
MTDDEGTDCPFEEGCMVCREVDGEEAMHFGLYASGDVHAVTAKKGHMVYKRATMFNGTLGFGPKEGACAVTEVKIEPFTNASPVGFFSKPDR